MKTSDWGEVWSKVVALVKSFSMMGCMPPKRKEIRAIPDFLMVGSQIANLTRSRSFGHNLCFRYPNGSCEPILNIDVPKYSEWYKKYLNIMSLVPWSRFLKVQKFVRTLTPKVRSSFGSVEVDSLTLSYTPRSMRCDSEASSWPAPLQALALVASPRLRLRQYTFIKDRNLQLVLTKLSDLVIDEHVQTKELEPLLVELEDFQLIKFEPINNHLTHGSIKRTACSLLSWCACWRQ